VSDSLLLALSACWGKWPSEALSTSGQADGFGSRAASVTRGSFRNAGLTETLMLLELCQFCRAGAAHPSSADLRCRRYGQSCLGAEGSKETRSAARREHLGPGLEAARARCPERHDATGAKVLGCFGSEGAMHCDTWPLRTCKEGTVQGRDKERRV
jgi:hypothetical protein